MIHPARIHKLNDKPARNGGFVLYWMQQSQRAEWNHALEYAIERANELDLPVAVVFGLMDNYPEACERHYTFMIQGLEETFQTLEQRGLGTFFERGHPVDVALKAGRNAALIVCDMGYLRHQAEWRARIAEEADCEVVEIESDVVVPVEVTSDHAEYMARTIRPKLLKRLDEFLQPVREVKLSKPWKRGEDTVPAFGKLDRPFFPHFKGGTVEAKRRLKKFIEESLAVYEAHSNQPQTDDVSALSPYL
ncbi:MAG: deoxyribodipyrimidine photo-lyase, partial [Verrucomicrobia bacterium]|nr:deoxyribodipyrimidine photo-lyase [Verrucomicrobiota bacterium]